MKKRYYLYIVTNPQNSMLYTGMTDNLTRRVFGYKNKLVQDFASQFNLSKLVYYEIFQDHFQALYRKKQLKVGSRHDKIRLIESKNPHWNDLYYWSFVKKPLPLKDKFRLHPPVDG
jgi:putative endonuclease